MDLKDCEKKDKGLAEIVIAVGPEEFETALGNAYIKNRSRISVPGFRKGKAPRKTIERMYGSSVFHTDALDALIPEVMEYFKTNVDYKIYGKPQVTDADIKDDSSGVDFTITVSLYPDVTIGEYKGLSADKPDVEIPESDVDHEVDEIRRRNARIEKVDRSASDGDIVVIDFNGFIDGEAFDGGAEKDFELTLGSNSLIPGFEEGIIGMTAGEERDLKLVFPDDYKESLAGMPVVFKVLLSEVKERILPELDDEFAMDVSEFDTIEEYKSDIRERLLKAKQSDADDAFEGALMDEISDTLEADIPDEMIEAQMDIAVNSFARQISAYGMDPVEYMKMMNVTPGEFREQTRANSERRVKTMLALEKIADLEGIEANEEDIEQEYIKAAGNMNMEIDKIKESVPIEKVAEDIRLRLASKLVVDSATVRKQ